MAGSFFIVELWKDEVKVLLENKEKLSHGHDTDAIHDLRVAVKKLRSYLQLLSLIMTDADFKPDFEKTERLFKVLGKHRDLEVGLSLMDTLEKKNNFSYGSIRFQLVTGLKRTGEWVDQALRQYDPAGLAAITIRIEQLSVETGEEELLKNINLVLKKEFRKLKQSIRKFRSNPHEMRKKLKNAYYWISACPPDFILDKTQLGAMKKTLDLLGDWQDHEMLQIKTKHFRKDFIPPSHQEFQMLKDLEKYIQDRMSSLLEKTEKSLSGFSGF